jgi:hypothetical protein
MSAFRGKTDSEPGRAHASFRLGGSGNFFFRTGFRRADAARLQQAFIESAVEAIGFNQVNFQNPVPLAAKLVRIAHPFRVSRMDAIQVFIAGDVCVSELADEMARDSATKNPSRFRSRFLRKRVQTGTGHVR